MKIFKKVLIAYIAIFAISSSIILLVTLINTKILCIEFNADYLIDLLKVSSIISFLPAILFSTLKN